MMERRATESIRDEQTTVNRRHSAGRRARWQLLVIPSADCSKPPVPKIRIDAAEGLASPHFPLSWSQQVGWHNPTASEPARPIQNSSSAIAKPHFNLHSHQEQPPVSTHQVEQSFHELAEQLAVQIRMPLAAAHQVVQKISHQSNQECFLSLDDRGLLSGASDKLALLTEWTDSILSSGSNRPLGPRVIRSRFTPREWQQRVAAALSVMAEANNISIQWVGWDQNLPALYLDGSHFTRAMFYLIGHAIASSSSGSHIILRASWQNNISQRLLLTIEDSGVAWPAELLRVVNSTSAVSSIQSNCIGLQTARNLITLNGGILAAQRNHQDGNVVRVSLPVNIYASMIRAWLLQNVTAAEDRSQYQIALFEFRCQARLGSQFDSFLQQCASPRQFVYRSGEHQWMVLELKQHGERSDSTLMAAAERQLPQALESSQPWFSQGLYTTESFILAGLLGQSDSELRLPRLTEILADRFEKTLAGRPAVQSELPEPTSLIPAPHFNRRPPAVSSAAAPSPSAGGQASSAEQPGAQIVSEIVKQWKSVQAKLAVLDQHPMINHSEARNR